VFKRFGGGDVCEGDFLDGAFVGFGGGGVVYVVVVVVVNV
jgi:hypothetical protein